VLERRSMLGGAAVTEEIVPGFKFSRFAYLAGLLRPTIISELDLHRHGLVYLPRTPSSFTPSPVNGDGRSLILGASAEEDAASIAQFSAADAAAYPEYEAFLGQCRDLVTPLLDSPPPNPLEAHASIIERARAVSTLSTMVRAGFRHKDAVVPFYELFTAPAAHVLDRWFEGEVLKATLATDAVIGAIVSPNSAGSAYVLLHHVMGEAAGRQGVWAYCKGGMGAVSDAIGAAAKEAGAELVTGATVAEIKCDSSGKASAVQMSDGRLLRARRAVLSNANPHHTFLDLINPAAATLPPAFAKHVAHADYSCGAFKINLALSGLPNFACMPSSPDGAPGPQHRGTIHFASSMAAMDIAYLEAARGIPATRPVVEMTIPSSLDDSIAPPGQHVCQLFVQYAPYELDPACGSWADEAFKQRFVDRVLDVIEQYAPGFRSLILGIDVISPLDLERILGLHKGNIFHGSLALHQLAYARPVPGWSSHRTPMRGLYLCGAGTHPGGGVMGAAGRNTARIVLADLGVPFR